MEFLKLHLLLSPLLFLTLCATVAISHSFFPVDNYLIDCGSAVDTTIDNRQFVSDVSGANSPSSSKAHTFSLRNENPSVGNPQIYNTARIFKRPTEYTFLIKDKGTHTVRLHFHAFNSSKFDLDMARFHVLINKYVVLGMSGVGDMMNNPVIKEYFVRVDSDKLVINFVPLKGSHFGFVNAIEVISSPKDLVADTVQYVTSEKVENIDGFAKEALEVVYRVNVGGPKVTPFNDSLWRTWVPDDQFLKSSKDVDRVYFSGRIKYQKGGASREVGPDNMYNTARVIRSVKDVIPHMNMTWEFPVVMGYKYLVRMHFCDIASMSLGLLYFNVYVNGYLAMKDLDLSSVWNMLAAPFYADFVVDGNCNGVLTVSVGPSNMSLAYNNVDAILNGVEIMKLNNRYGSLDGSLTDVQVMASSTGKTIGFTLSLIAFVCIFLSLVIVVRMKMKRRSESAQWTRLPLSEDTVKVQNPQ